MKGYMGKVLSIDLSTGAWESQSIDDTVYENLLSGVGLGAYYLYKNIPASADPLGPENILGFISGLLTGTGSVMTGRWMAVCKSPLTGGWGDSNCGGDLSPAIKQCGYDAIFLRGISPTPVYVYIDNKGPEIRDASPYWGMDAIEAEKALIRDTRKKKKPAVAVIGPAGEKLSLISGISNDLGRYAARSGVGAVMGSKRVKALVLAGTKVIKAADKEGIKELSREYGRKVRLMTAPPILRGSMLPLMGKVLMGSKYQAPLDGMMTVMLLKRFGSSMNNTLSIPIGDAPFKNWAGTNLEYNRSYYRHIDPDRLRKRETGKYHCYSCVIGCGSHCDISDIADGRFSRTHNPEYETVMVFGGLLMNRDLESILYVNELLNRAGLDTISVGGVVAFAIECFENGILTEADTGGLRLAWGDGKSIVALVEKIIARDGIGEILVDGVKKAAERIGKGSEKYAVHAGGQELPMHDPKIDPVLGVTYSADPTPGRHTTSGGMYYSTSFLWRYVSWAPRLRKHLRSDDYVPSEAEARKNVAMTCFKMLIDGTGGCYYGMLTGAPHLRIFDYLNRATGWNRTPDEYMETGKRIQTLRQMFNVKHGVDTNSFRMHGRAAGHPPLKAGRNKGLSLRLDEMISLYRQGWGWDPATGIPTRETFDKLGLGTTLGLEYAHG